MKLPLTEEDVCLAAVPVIDIVTDVALSPKEENVRKAEVRGPDIVELVNVELKPVKAAVCAEEVLAMELELSLVKEAVCEDKVLAIELELSLVNEAACVNEALDKVDFLVIELDAPEAGAVIVTEVDRMADDAAETLAGAILVDVAAEALELLIVPVMVAEE